jgi:homoserine kinase type II
MAVFTKVTPREAGKLLERLGLGPLTALKGIQGGIENTNYFALTEQGDYVLTLFERLSHEQLPFYLHLMRHLAEQGIPVPAPKAAIANVRNGPKLGDILHTLKGKPAAVVSKLTGKSQLEPQAVHCAAVGDMLARMHLAGQSYPHHQPNLRGLLWWNATVPVVLPHLSVEQRALIESELAYQNHVAAQPEYRVLPQGAIHADLFRDNVMFDVAVCLNDWCVDLPTGQHHAERANAFVAAYQRVRPFTAAERTLFPALLRAGALRFWISRLWDFYLPREASMLTPHDPTHFERILTQRRTHWVTAPCN